MNPELYNAALHGSPDFGAKLKGVLDSTTDHEQLITSGQKNTILHIAAKTGKLHIEEDDDSVLRFLYDQNKKGDTPLHIAAKLGNLEMTRILVAMAKKADVEQNRKLLSMVNHEKDTVLHQAVRHNRFEVVKLLIEEDQDLASTENSAGEFPLFIAVYGRFFQVAFHILDSAPNCSFAGRRGMNVLHAAVIRSHSWKVYNLREAVLLLLRNICLRLGLGRLYSFRKAKKTITVIYQNPSLYSATKMENISHDSSADIVCELLGRFEGRLLMEKADDFGWIPLHYATYIGHTGRVYQLLDTDNRSLALTRTKHGMSALHISPERGHVDVIKLLIGKCPEICESLDEKDQTALHVAVKNKRKNVVKYFLQSLAFQDLVNEKDKNGNTALHLAASMINEGDIEILKILAHDSNIDKGAVNKAGMTFVDILFSNKQLKGFERLEIMSNWEREIYFPSYMKETREANQSTPGESKSNETQVEEKGGKVVDNNPTTEDIKKQKQQNYEQVNQPCKDFAPVSATSDLPSPEIMPKLQETSFGRLSSTALSDTATATANTGSSIFGFGDTATSTADNQTQGSTFLAASVPMLITQPSSAGIGISTFTQSMPLQFGSSTSSPSIGESKTDETQVEEKGGKVVDNNPTTEDIKMQKQQYYEQVNQTLKDFAPVLATSDLPSPEIVPEQETSFGTLSSTALSDTAAATATSTADNQTQGSTFLAASVSMPITQPSSAGTGISIFTESMPVQFGSSTSSPSFGLAGTTTLASGNSISVSTAAKLFTTGTTGLGSSATLSETNSIGSGSGTTPGLFGFSFGASTASSASANSLPAVFGSSTASAGAKNSVPTVFGSSNGSSASSVSSFTSPSTTALIPPVFGNPNSVCAFGSATSADNDQMNMKDSMAEDTVAAAGPSVPVFGQQPTPATTSGYVFGSVSPSVGNPFQFGSQQNLAAPQYTSPIQASGSLGFIADGSNFSRGSGGAGGGGDKNSRRIIKVKHNKMRKK